MELSKDDSLAEIFLTANRAIFVNDIDKKEAEVFTALILNYIAEAPDQPITLMIDSFGGDVDSLMLIQDMLSIAHTNNCPVRTVCLARAWSAGAIILSSGTKGHRWALANSSIMIHGAQCVFPIMGEDDLANSEKYFDFINSCNEQVMSLISTSTGKDIETIRKDCEEDLYMSAEEALAYGLIDGIATDIDQII